MKFIIYVLTTAFYFFPLSASNTLDISTFKKQLETEKTPAGQAKAAFAVGVLHYRSEDKNKSKEFFELAIKNNSKLSDYSHFFLGLLDIENKNYSEAKKHFTAVAKAQPQSIRKIDAELQLALIAKQEEQWLESLKLLKMLEKKYRRDIKHEDILQTYFDVAQAKKIKSEACYAALKIYTKFPMHPMDPQSVGCTVRLSDQEKRFTQLLLNGEFEQIKKEIPQDRKSQSTETGFYETQMGRVHLAEGKIKDAIENFRAAQEILGKTFSLYMLLGKAYSQTENYAAAIEAYTKAYEMAPRNKKGHLALFQAAFLSYQNRDYDGAARRFEQLLRTARGKILLDTKWHMAWIRYLKEDYSGAIKAFTELSMSRGLDKVDKEKLLYWRGMCKLRMGFSDEAHVIFSQLAQEKRYGYYTIAAQARLATIPARPAFVAPKEERPNESQLRAPNVEVAVDNESLGAPEPVTQDLGTPEEEVAATEEEVPVTTLKDPLLALRFEKAKDLIELHIDDAWARAELKEIEKRTRNMSYLQLLMTEYAKVGEYNRSAYIGDVVFSQVREKGGFEGAHVYWTHAFPQAYGNSVKESARKFGLPPTIVWSVMRGESAFKEDIHSPAGALGLMQLIPKTGKRVAENLGLPLFRKEMLLNPDTNIQFGSWYLKRLSRLMDKSLPLVFASYNAGPHRVQGWLKEFGHLDADEFIEHIPYIETRNYVKKILRNYFIYETLYAKRNEPLDWITKKFTAKFYGPKPAMENWDE